MSLFARYFKVIAMVGMRSSESMSETSNPSRRLAPMREAAGFAYRSTAYRIVAFEAEDYADLNADDSDDRILEYYTNLIVSAGNVNLYGEKQPSKTFERIPDEEIISGTFRNGGNDLVSHGELDPRWRNIFILKSDLRTRLRHIRETPD